MNYPSVPCPKCSRLLKPAGVITLPDGAETPSYQCDECLQTVEMFGEKMEVALTFCIGPDGKPFDPAEGADFG
jgi:hypothetical protein